MDAERRRQIEERRAFAKARWQAKQWREGLQPALGALEASGEPFRVFGLGEGPRWNPAWIPSGYTYIPWITSMALKSAGTSTSVARWRP